MNSRILRLRDKIVQVVRARPRLFGLLAVWFVIGASIGLSRDLASNPMQVLTLLVLVGVATSLLVWCVRKGDWRGLGLDLSIELTGAIITYLLLELAVGGTEEKSRLVTEMRSKVNDVAVVALEKVRQRGWLEDGSLNEADLHGANLPGASLPFVKLREASLYDADLQGAELAYADLRGADLFNANLQGAILNNARLQGARLIDVNLEQASLQRANLQGARLTNANLQGADLNDARLGPDTTLPDDTKWTPGTDMARFTDPDHPDFWRSDHLYSPAYRGRGASD